MFSQALRGGKREIHEDLNHKPLLIQACGLTSHYPHSSKNHPKAETLKWYPGPNRNDCRPLWKSQSALIREVASARDASGMNSQRISQVGWL